MKKLKKVEIRKLILFYLLFLSFLFCQVDTAWVRRYDGLAHFVDVVSGLVVDRTGNVYVTGWCDNHHPTYMDFTTIKYNPYGDILWIAQWNYQEYSLERDPSIALDSFGNIYIVGELFYNIPPELYNDYVIIKYNCEGEIQWFKIYYNPRKFDYPKAVAVDNLNNIYVTGGGDNLSAYLTIKYNSNGEEEWVRKYYGNWACAWGIAVDKENYIYVTGWVSGSYVTIKYAPNGSEEWIATYPTNTSYWEYPLIAVDTFGNVYIAGVSNGDYLTIKYNSNGQVVWVRTYNGPGNGYDRARALAVDKLGNVYVSGYSEGNETNFDYATIKYNPNGVEEWIKRFNGFGNGPDSARAISVDNSGNVYVTGASWNGFNFDYLTIKYSPKNPNRIEEWIIRYNGPDNQNDFAYCLVVDNYENVYVSGISESIKHNYDYTTIKYLQNSGIEMKEKKHFSFDNSSLEVYPNPAKDAIYIKNPLSKKEIKIFDISGNLIKVLKIMENKNKVSLNNIKEGIYFIKIDNKQQKLIIQK